MVPSYLSMEIEELSNRVSGFSLRSVIKVKDKGLSIAIISKKGRRDSPLHIACRESDDIRPLKNLLLRVSTDINIRNHSGLRPLHYAILSRNTEAIELLLERRDILVNCRDEVGRTPLFLACLMGYVKEAKSLIMDKRIDPNITDRDCRSPLVMSIKSKRLGLAKLLIDMENIDVNVFSDDGLALTDLCKSSNRILDLLLQKYMSSPDIFCVTRNIRFLTKYACEKECVSYPSNKPSKKKRFRGSLLSPELWLRNIDTTEIVIGYYTERKERVPIDNCYDLLLTAAKVGSPEVIRYLVKIGANPNLSTTKISPLALACYYSGRSEIAKTLLDIGADPNLITPLGSPLKVACHEGRVECIKLLLERGATGSEELFKRMCMIGSKEVVETLLARRITYDITPILYGVCKANRSEICDILLKDCSKAKKMRKTGDSLIIAAELGHYEVCEVLLGHEIDPNYISDNGDTPLHKAASLTESTVCEILIKNGADLNITNSSDQTALTKACQSGSIDIVRILLEEPKMINHVDDHAKSSVDYACEKKRFGIVKLLLSKGATPHPETCKCNS